MIKSFNQFQNEGLKTNLLVALLSLFGTASMSQTTPNKITTHTHNQNSIQSYIKQGWSLDSTQIDTLFKQIKSTKPDTNLVVVRMQIDKNKYFKSGEYTLSQNVKDSISNQLYNINGIITHIVTTSSTDKQQLTPNLQKELSQIGFTPDNRGLSKARNHSISNFLTDDLDVNKSLITPLEKFEQGDSIIEQSARFITVDIYYLEVKLPPPISKPEISINKTFYFSKIPTTKTQNHKGIITKFIKIPVNRIKNRITSCSAYL